MGNVLLALVGVAYVGVLGSYLVQRQPGMALAFFGYAVANVGFIWQNVLNGVR